MFDLDGTLIDSALDIAHAANYTLRSLGHEELDVKTIRGFIGDGSRMLMYKCLGVEREGLVDEALAIYLERYRHHSLDYTLLFPGVEEVLDYYKDKKKAVVTNKVADLSVDVLRGLGVYDRLDMVLGGDSTEEGKPSAQPINAVLTDLKIDRSRALMVGDSIIDIQTGLNAGVATCGVTYGLGEKADLEEAGAELIVDDILELKRFFR